MTLGFPIRFIVDSNFPPWYPSIVTAFFSLSLGVNTLVTALVVYKIVTVYNDIREFNARNFQTGAHRDGPCDFYPLISILIESGLITFVWQLAQLIMYTTTSSGFSLIYGCVVIVYVSLCFLSIVDLMSSCHLGDFDDIYRYARRDGHHI